RSSGRRTAARTARSAWTSSVERSFLDIWRRIVGAGNPDARVREECGFGAHWAVITRGGRISLPVTGESLTFNHSTGGLALKSPKGRILFESSLVVVLGAAVLGAMMALKQGNDYKFMDPLIETESIIARQFVEEPDMKKMQDGAI